MSDFFDPLAVGYDVQACETRQLEPPEHWPEDLIRIFDRLFAHTENTRLIRGGSEPVYLPAGDSCAYHQVVFAHGFFSSALHEIAHWCLAGQQRRLLMDYGYWYAADGRSREQQGEFERVEIKPQALEWILSKACGKGFRISVDNLSGEPSDPAPFKQAVYQQVLSYCQQGLPKRAETIFETLTDFYQTGGLNSSQFHVSELG